MKIVFISDTHGSHKGLVSQKFLPEDADAICHCGDYSPRGGPEDLKNFLDWFSKLDQFKHKIFISGNHDLFASENNIRHLIPDNVHYLEDSSVVLDGIKFYGTPWQPIFLDWGFNLHERYLVEKYAMIPEDTDVLLTHCPPANVLDLAPAYWNNPARHCGSPSLLERVKIVNPIVHAFGHIHEGYGELSLFDNITFLNCAVLNGRYQLTNYPLISHVVKNETTN